MDDLSTGDEANLDFARARRHLGWQPRVDLEDGLRETIDYMRCQPVTL